MFHEENDGNGKHFLDTGTSSNSLYLSADRTTDGPFPLSTVIVVTWTWC